MSRPALDSQKDQEEWERSCLGKLAYTSASAADAALRMYRKSVEHPSSLRAYPCRFCEKWHIAGGHK